MRPVLTFVALSLVATSSLAQTPTAASVEVNYDKPEHFRDASLDSNGYERGADEHVMKELRSYLQTLGKRYLPPGQAWELGLGLYNLFDIRFSEPAAGDTTLAGPRWTMPQLGRTAMLTARLGF